MRWLAVYVALSRVRSLAQLKSRGLNDKILAIIEGGPPDTIPEQFERYFGEKERKTAAEAATAMKALDWPESYLKKGKDKTAAKRARVS